MGTVTKGTNTSTPDQHTALSSRSTINVDPLAGHQ
jgi:hypothetical protein